MSGGRQTEPEARSVPGVLAVAGVVGPVVFTVGFVAQDLLPSAWWSRASFPLRADAMGLVYDPTGVHTVNGAIFFWSIGIGLVVLARPATCALATGVVLLVMTAITGQGEYVTSA